MRQRRRAERGNFSQLRDRSQPVVSRRDAESKQRQFLFAGVAFALAVVAGLLAYGWFDTSFSPPRRTVGEISGGTVKLADLVSYSALESFETGNIDPESGLNNLIRDTIMRTYAPELGIEVVDHEVDDLVIRQFDSLPPGASEPADELSQAGRVALDAFLGALPVTEEDYRQWLVGRIHVTELQSYFSGQVPEAMEQVFVEWIVTASTVTAQDAFDRVEAGEEFANVADELSIEQAISGPGGELGWVPKGAIKELDSILFAEDLVLGQAIGPLVTTAGSVVLRVTDGPSEQPVDTMMRGFLATNAFQSWLNDKVEEAVVELPGLSLDDTQWVIEQII